MVSPALQGVFRSLRLYHGRDAPKARMDALYVRFIAPGNIAFDIGAHVGDRVSSFRRLGARVVAVEPQPMLLRALRLIHGRDPGVILIPSAVGTQAGTATLHVNSRNPTVSTLSDAFMVEASGAEGWENQIWDRAISVPVVTVDQLITTFGPPQFIKIDVEGVEDQVLLGLNQPVPALSFEFTTIARDVAMRCLERLSLLGPYRFDIVAGESQVPTFHRWLSAQEMAHHIRNLPHAANSGDVYAVLAEQA
jgi:FkbM family methyltransferase